MTIQQLKLLSTLLRWATRQYPEPKVARELLTEVDKEIKLRTLNPVTGNYESGD